MQRAAAPGDPLDRPGGGQGGRQFGRFGAAHLALAQIAAAPAAHLQAFARSPALRPSLLTLSGFMSIRLSIGTQLGPRIGMEKGPLTGVGAGLSR